MNKVTYLHGTPPEIGLLHRVDRQDHRMLEKLHAANRFRPSRAVFSATSIATQSDLLKVLKDDGVEIVLDPNTVDLSSVGRYGGKSADLPWAITNRPLKPADLLEPELLQRIAVFAAEYGVNRVLAPSCFNADLEDNALALNIEAAHRFGEILKEIAGDQVAVDFVLATRYRAFNDRANRVRCVSRLSQGDFEYLWLRIADYGADAPASKIQRYILSASDYSSLRKPLIADLSGGVAGLAPAAFGVISGIAQGVSSLQRLDASSLLSLPKPRPALEEGGGFGIPRRVYLPQLDRALKVRDLQTILNSRGARRLLLCQDDCCPHGAEMLENPKAHSLNQQIKQIRRLQAVPFHRRTEIFIDREIKEMSRTARQTSQLRVGDPSLVKILGRAAKNIEDKRMVLEGLQQRADGKLFTAPPLPASSPANDGTIATRSTS